MKSKEKNIKIGLVTILDNSNFGNRLQNYALSKYLTDAFQAEVRTLSPKRRPNADRAFTNLAKEYILFKFIKYIPNYRLHCSDTVVRSARFIEWNKLIKMDYSEQDGEIINKGSFNAYDLFVAGSDQIWNYNFSKNRFSDYFLKFAPKEKRFAVSASIGASEIPKHLQEEFKESINEFSGVTVREEQAAEIVFKLTGSRPKVTIDPVMLLSSNKWEKMMRIPNGLGGNYCFLHIIGDYIPKKLLNSINLEHCDIVSINDSQNQDIRCAGPKEFLGMIYKSNIVITDSFHCLIFAILFKKPFLVYERNDLDMRSRIDTLLSQFGFENRRLESYVGDPFKIDYSDTDQLLTRYRNELHHELRKFIE